MCLSTVKSSVKVGYKVVTAYGGVMRSEYQSNHRYNTNEWNKAEAPLVVADEGGEYVAGFHIFTSIGAAANWSCSDEFLRNDNRVVKVEYRGVVAEGLQYMNHTQVRRSFVNLVPIVVALQIRIVEVIDAKRAIAAGVRFAKRAISNRKSEKR
jgi:hypothetical protein